MSARLFNLLKDLNDDLERIERELKGYTYELIVTGKGRSRKEYYQEYPPEKTPRFQKSDVMEDLIDIYYPETIREEKQKQLKTSAKRLLEAWQLDFAGFKKKPSLKRMNTIFDMIQPILQVLYANENTFAVAATTWRAPIKKMFGDKSEEYKQSIYKLGISQERSIAMKQKYKEDVRQGVRTRGSRVKYSLEHILGVIDAASTSNNPVDNIIAVLLCTGSRLIECIKVSQYELVPDQADYIKLVGVAKTRTNQEGNEQEVRVKKTIVKPVIRITPQRIIEMVQNIRAAYNLQFVSNAQATGKVNSSVNRKLKEDYFAEVDAKLPETKQTTAHKLRYLYAQIAYYLYGKPESIPENEFVREVLGHDSGEVSLTYQQILVNMGEVIIPSDYRLKLNELRQDTNEIKQDLKETKKEIDGVKIELNKGIEKANKIHVQFPEYVNSKRLRLSTEEKMNRLRQLDQALQNAGLRVTQKLMKKYGYGSRTVQVYYNQRVE